MFERTFNAIVARLENDNLEYRSLLKYYYTIQAFILGGFVYCYNMFGPNFERGKSSSETWILFSICIIGLIYCIKLIFNYLNFSRTVSENYKHLIMLEPYIMGRIYAERIGNAAQILYKWETYSLCLLVLIWISLCIFITKAEKPVEFILLGTFASIMVFLIIICIIFALFLLIRRPEQELKVLKKISKKL